MRNLFDSDTAMDVLGVHGHLVRRTTKPGDESGAPWLHQEWVSEARRCAGYGGGAMIRAEVRFDDRCGNGHNTFSITGDIYKMAPGRTYQRKIEIAGGCLHDEIVKSFPELASLIRWHLTSSDGPMHYIANTLYHAGDLDHNGLRAGERRQIINGRTKLPCWELVAVNVDPALISNAPTGDNYRGADAVPLFIVDNRRDAIQADLPPVPQFQWRPLYLQGEGKARNLDAARSAAVWPEATDEELRQPRDGLKAALEARHAALCAAFRSDVERSGLAWEPRLYREPRDA